MELTEEEILQILKLLDESQFEELSLQIGDIKLVAKKRVDEGKGASTSVKANAAKLESRTKTIEVKKAGKRQPRPSATGVQVNKVAEPQVEEAGLFVIKASVLGTFYRAPKPGDPHFVEEGSFVTENDTVCLLEVMKVYTAVKAGIRGQVVKVCAESGKMVEYGQALFMIRPSNGKAGAKTR